MNSNYLIKFDYKNKILLLKKIDFKYLRVFTTCLILKISISYFLIHFLVYFKSSIATNNPFKDFSFKFLFFLTIIAAPLIETFFYQLLPYYILKYFKIRKVALRILIPSIMFGASHYYNLQYVIVATIMGSILNYFYLYSVAHRKNAFLWVVILHSLYNLVGLF